MKLHVAAVAWVASTLASSCNADEQIYRHGEEQPRRRELSQRWLNETQDFVDEEMSDVSAEECMEGEDDCECECFIECFPVDPEDAFPLEPTREPTPGPTPEETTPGSVQPPPVPIPGTTPGPTTPGSVQQPSVPMPGTTPSPTTLTTCDIEAVIREVAIYEGTEFQDQGSYQSQALAWLLQGSPSACAYSRTQLIQRYAMACIYYSTFAVRTVATDAFLGTDVTPAGWDRADAWLSSSANGDDVCSWYGLECNSEFRVTAIHLGDNYLTGSFPREVTLVNETLTNLTLTANPVFNDGDYFNEFLGELPALRVLELQATNFRYTGGLPPQLAKLSKLVKMDISNTLFRGPIDGSIFANMPSLEYLDLSKNKYGSPVPIQIGQLPSLKYFYAVNSNLTGDLSFMEPMTMIEDLWVDLNPNLSGGIPSFIGEKTTLTSLGLSACRFFGELPTSMGLLMNMESLWLYGNLFSGSIPAEFGEMPKLKLLKVHWNDIGGEIPQSVCNLTQGPLMDLTSDCISEVNCTCCTECY